MRLNNQVAKIGCCGVRLVIGRHAQTVSSDGVAGGTGLFTPVRFR